jgi:glyoxylase I family protein
MSEDQINPFVDSALTTILVVSDINVSKRFYIYMIEAKLFREYGGNSLVMEFLGHWMLPLTSGGPTEDK